jgi:hypothetical protein
MHFQIALSIQLKAMWLNIIKHGASDKIVSFLLEDRDLDQREAIW